MGAPAVLGRLGPVGPPAVAPRPRRYGTAIGIVDTTMMTRSTQFLRKKYANTTPSVPSAMSDRRPLRAPGAFGGVQVSGSEFRWNPNELFRDLEFENLVFQQAYASTALANRLDALAELTLEIIQGIESSD